MPARILLITLLFLGFCGSFWLNVQQHERAVQDKKALGDQLAGLKRQAAQIRAQPTPSASPSDAPTVPPLGPGQQRVKLSLYNVQLTVVDPITDLVYGEVPYNGGSAAGFTTESLLAEYPACKAGALGMLVRTKALPTPTRSPSPTPSHTPSPTRSPSNQPFTKTLGGFTYSYKSPQFSCVTDQAGRDTVAAAVAALKNQALPTMLR